MTIEIDIERYTSNDLNSDKLKNLIEQRKSFKIVAVNDISTVVNAIEDEIKQQGRKCRVYTEHRSSVMLGMVIPTGVTQLTGMATALGIGIHNLFTINPDYEIAKNKLNDTVTVIYKKN